MIAFLPRLSGFAYSLTGNADQRDDLVQETCVRALAHKDQWQPGTRSGQLDVSHRAEPLVRLEACGESSGVSPWRSRRLENLVGSDGRTVMESRLALGEVLRGLDQLSPEHRVLIGLVCVDGLTYQEAAGRSGTTRGDGHEQAGAGSARAPRCDQSSACFQGDHEIGDAAWPKFQMSC